PVPAGFDLFEPDLMLKYFGSYMEELGISFDTFMGLGRVNPEDKDQPFNMALFATRHAAFRNGVSELHGRVSREMMQPWWPGYPSEEVPVDSITNGIHLQSWVAPPIQEAYESAVGKGWSEPTRQEPDWSGVDKMKDKDVWANHMACKERFVALARKRALSHAKARGGSHREKLEAEKILDPNALTIGFARRFATYKRATLLLRDVERLKRLITNADRPIQFVFAGKAHPADAFGKELIKHIVHFSRDSQLTKSFVFIENYDIEVGRHVVAGVDVWLNNPRRPLEASGTSGMKAAANGVLNLSILDGWWAEGYETERGWAIGDGEEYAEEHYQDSVEASALYDLLEHEVIPTYYDRDSKGLPIKWIQKMKASMRDLGPMFNTNRMVGEYTEKFYIRAANRSHELTDGNLDRVHSLVDWSRRVSQHWSQVQVEGVTHRNGGELHVGAEVPVRVKVDLGHLSPGDVAVELYHGSADGDHQVQEGRVTSMNHVGEEDGHQLYEGMLTCGTSGLYGYSVRIVPAHPDALIPNEMPLITWY
ncbi:MAG: alpha-glucan family phosphorylase, partial [Candidatus Eisenbacteria bacterium]|nr:alpha-glucan family phosphorylase [Candidatus Eisenbacteria bacterium]